MIADIIAIFLFTVSFAILFSVPKEEWLFCGITGMLGWIFYSLLTDAIIAVFVAAAVVTATSRFLASKRKMPLTLFLISGIIPLVPGAGVYATMFNVIQGAPVAAAFSGISTFRDAGVIGLGIMLVLSLPGKWFIIH